MAFSKEKSVITAFPNTVEELKSALEKERIARKTSEERVRTIAAEHKRLEIELIRYRDHFETLVASRTAELMSINDQLMQENKQRRLLEREMRSYEDQFREANLLLSAVLNAIPDIIGVQDINHRMIRFNKAGYKFFGIDESQVSGYRCFELLGQRAPCDRCITEEIIQSGQPQQIIRYIDEKGIWMDIRAYPILDMDGRVTRIVEHWRDITELKKSEASLKESEEKYRLLIENANAGIFIYQDDKIQFSNRKAWDIAKAVGMARLKNSLLDCIHPDDRPEDLHVLNDRFNGKTDRPQALVVRVVGSSDNVIWIEANTVNITWEGHAATLNFIRDITQTKQMERRFQDAQRMESLGTLAGGIAHDFNNLLMGIQGNVSLMYLDIDPQHDLREKLKSIEDCVESGSRLTKQLLGFARGGKYVVEPMDMNQIVQSTAEMFGRTHKAVNINGDYAEGLWTVLVDRSQIEQVLVNIFLNAFQAMPGKGDLFIYTGNVELDATFVKQFDVSPGRYVKVSISDNGIGMDSATRRRIFEPFFTTHAPGMGTGLGLASAFGIIKNHNGVINVKSKLGKGSTFEIYLPITDEKPRLKPQTAEAIETGSETILLVDDEHYILEVGRLMLEGLGYQLITANGGRAALEIFNGRHKEIDLVILDMVMPDMDGETVFQKIREVSSKTKVIFASGYYDVEQARSLLENGAIDFLQKPFNLRRLSTKIRCILDS
jgi:two-component system cell cycle sensor histidine kinase/response regulator CckA